MCEARNKELVYGNLLKSTPLSGDFEEVIFPSNYGGFAWVEFIDSNGCQWVGKFGLGPKESIKLYQADNECFIILAGGITYLVNVNSRELQSSFSEYHFEDLILLDNTNQALATDGFHLFLLKKPFNIVYWQSERFSIEGIIFLSADENTVTGKFNDLSDNWDTFTFDLESKAINSNSVITNNLF